MINFKVKKISIFLIFLIHINSCSEKEDKKLLGQIIGSVAGAYLGSKVGSGISKNISTVVGGTVGFLLGGKIIELLNDEERNDFNETINHSLNENPNNLSNEWNSKKSIETKGKVTPLNSYKIDNKTCRDFIKIIDKDNKKYEEKSTACRDENGDWKII